MSKSEEIIELVRKHPVLYDPSHLDNKNPRKRDAIWEEIAEELGETVELTKKKWKNIKDSYAKYLRAAVSDIGITRYKNWRWAHEMEHFRPYFTKGEGKQDFNTTIKEEDDFSNPPTIKYEGVLPTIEDQRITCLTELATTSWKEVEPESSKRKRKAVVVEEDPLAQPTIEQKFNTSTLDATELVFLGFAKTVKNFSPVRQARITLKIAEILLEQELEQERGSSDI